MNEKPTAEEFRAKLEKEYPLEQIRNIEIKRTARNLLRNSTVGKVSSIIYFVLAIASIFIYSIVLNLNVILAILLGIITWFVVTMIFDRLIIKVFGVEQKLKEINEKDIQDSMEKLKKSGMFK